jgi:hypothetical protein
VKPPVQAQPAAPEQRQADPLDARSHMMTERNGSGYRLIIGFDNLTKAQDAMSFLVNRDFAGDGTNRRIATATVPAQGEREDFRAWVTERYTHPEEVLRNVTSYAWDAWEERGRRAALAAKVQPVAVPEAKQYDEMESPEGSFNWAKIEGWNECRAAVLAAAPAPAQQDKQAGDVARDAVRYTCIGKGGEYELLGVAYGAGSSRGNTVNLYREIATGVTYFRTPTDFAERMQMIARPATEQKD